MAILLKATAHVRMFMMVQSADHISALTGATVSKEQAAKAIAGLKG